MSIVDPKSHPPLVTVPSDTLPPPEAGLNIIPGAADDGWHTPPPVTLSDGTVVRLYKDGECLRAWLDAIRVAKRRILLEIYILRNDATGRVFTDALIERARAGVAVYFIYDSQGTGYSNPLLQEMKQAGIRVGEFHPLLPWRCRYSWRPWNRDHRKVLVVDDVIGGVGGLNIGDEYAGLWVAGQTADLRYLMRDTGIRIDGPAVRSLVRAFASNWRYIRNGGRVRRALFTYNIAIGPLRKGHRPGKARHIGRPSHGAVQADFALIASVPTLVSPLRPVLNDILRRAEQSITIIMAYFAPDDELIHTLCDAAKRGIKVRLILPGKSDVAVMQIAARSFYATLLEAGVEIYERNVAILHAKMLLVDDRVAIVGSTNLDYRSTELNLEIFAILTSNEFGRQVLGMFDHDVRFSTRIDPKHWRRRPKRDRLIQWLVSRARYLL